MPIALIIVPLVLASGVIGLIGFAAQVWMPAFWKKNYLSNRPPSNWYVFNVCLNTCACVNICVHVWIMIQETEDMSPAEQTMRLNKWVVLCVCVGACVYTRAMCSCIGAFSFCGTSRWDGGSSQIPRHRNMPPYTHAYTLPLWHHKNREAKERLEREDELRKKLLVYFFLEKDILFKTKTHTLAFIPQTGTPRKDWKKRMSCERELWFFHLCLLSKRDNYLI
jgi:hypothetical protein